MSFEMISKPNSICTQIVVLILLSGCDTGNSGDDTGSCSSTLNTSTSPAVEVDINGNVTPISTPTSTFSDCESSAEGDALHSSKIVTHFESTENYNVWDCIRADGSSLHYALFPYRGFSHASRYRHYGFEIDPGAADPIGSQQLYAWKTTRSADADTMTLWTQERIGKYIEGIESEWTNITFTTADTMNVNSSTEGPMQCNRSVGTAPLDSPRFDIPCKYRGPIFAC